jgi:hypothetical protein
MRTIIALCGPAGAGKSTLAKLLYQKHMFVRTSFATPLKEMIGIILKYQGASTQDRLDMLYGNKKEIPTKYLANRTPRYAMQTLGSEWRDMIHRNLWTEIWENMIRNEIKEADLVVDDMRFFQEAVAVRGLDESYQTYIIQISRPGCSPGVHISEQEYLSIFPDLIIDNSGTPELMLSAVEEFINERK